MSSSIKISAFSSSQMASLSILPIYNLWYLILLFSNQAFVIPSGSVCQSLALAVANMILWPSSYKLLIILQHLYHINVFSKKFCIQLFLNCNF